jgi:hypothetical protein
MLRIALRGDFAFVNRSLVAVRVHGGAESAAVAEFSGSGYEAADDMPAALYRQRLAFLDDASLDRGRDRRYRATARGVFRRDTVGRLTVDLRRGRRSRGGTVRELGRLARRDPGALFTTAAGKLVASLALPRRPT